MSEEGGIKNHFELDWLKRWAEYAPKHVALRDPNGRRDLTYADLYKLSTQIAHELKARGVKKGDRVGVLAKNSLEYVVLLFGAQRTGAILLPMNHRLAKPEIEYILTDSTPTLVLAEEEFKQANETLAWTEFFAAVKMQTTEPLEFVTEAEDPCLLLYTSGTTGKPKGALINHRMIFWNTMNTTMRLDVSASDVQLSFAPFFHTGGWNVLMLPYLHRGAKSLLIEKFDAEQVLDLCQKEKVTMFFAVPTMLDLMARSNKFETADLRSVKFIVVGGEPMPLELIRIWEKKGIPVRQGYGLTEFGPSVFSLNEEDSIRKIGSIGFPNFYIQTRIVNNDGQDVPTGEIGELWLKGPVAIPGYWKNPQATQQLFEGEWLKTGDLVKKDEEGYFYVSGRKKEMFISGGENIYPAEIEHALRTHGDVLEAAVIGIPDPKWGEAGRAYIVAKKKLSEEELLDHCRAKLARFKVPKSVVFLDALPKSDSGKILKRELSL
jgi:fatty-acyl-CoA synthase